MTTGSDMGLSVIQAHDVQNPLHFGEMKVRQLWGASGWGATASPSPTHLGLVPCVGTREGCRAQPQSHPYEVKLSRDGGGTLQETVTGPEGRVLEPGILEGPEDTEDRTSESHFRGRPTYLKVGGPPRDVL